MKAIEITCPHCNTSALVSQEDLGYTIDCPACEESFEAPRMAKRSVHSEPEEVIPTAEAEKSQAIIEPDKSEKATSLAESSHGQNAMNTSLFVEEKKAVSDDASPISDSRTGEIGPPKKVAGLDDVLGRQKARGPKKDKWADFEKPTKGRKMSCWRCGYQGRAPDQKRSVGEALLGFRVPVCPRCKALNAQRLPILTRICYYTGFVIFFFPGLIKLFSAFRYFQRDWVIALSGLTQAAILLFLSLVCIKALAKHKSICSAKRK